MGFAPAADRPGGDPGPNHLATPQDLLLQPRSPDQEALIRLRLAAAVSLLAELILPAFEASAYSKPDWLAIEGQTIWFVLTVALLAATWLPRFTRGCNSTLLLF